MSDQLKDRLLGLPRLSDQHVDHILAVAGGILGGVATALFTINRWLNQDYRRTK